MRASIVPLFFFFWCSIVPNPSFADELSNATEAARGVNRFALKLYSEIGDEDGNVFFSPYSISTAFAIAYHGARANTKAQIKDVAGFASSDAKVPIVFRKLLEEMSRSQGSLEFFSANALWMKKGFSFLDSFVDNAVKNYSAAIKRIDFETDPASAASEINRWVAENTKNKIDKIVESSDLNAEMRLVITNAVYFKANWSEEFEESFTKEQPFWVADGNEPPVPLMTQTKTFLYAEDKDAQMLELPYLDSSTSMVVVLPRKRGGLGDLEKSLDLERIEALQSSANAQEVKLFLPRFKFEDSMTLVDALSKIGMKDVFDPGRADFSGITGGKDVFISDILHKGIIEVDEKGTEAAAVTALIMRATGMPVQKPKPKIFKADHPFLFLIREERTGLILFMGRYRGPKTE